MIKKSFSELFNSSSSSEPTNECLFNDVCPTGYFSKEALLEHLNALSSNPKLQWQLEHLKMLFNFFKANGTLSRDPQHTTEDGKSVTWMKLTIGKVSKSIKIIHFADIKQLIDDYANGSVKINQTLEELYNEALS